MPYSRIQCTGNYATGTRFFSGLIGRAGSFSTTVSSHGEAAQATAEVVTGNFFQVLGVDAALGRVLIPSDDGGSLGYGWRWEQYAKTFCCW